MNTDSNRLAYGLQFVDWELALEELVDKGGTTTWQPLAGLFDERARLVFRLIEATGG